MLYLSRKIGESIIINNDIELTVVEVRGKTVKLGFNFPKEATILRKELHEKITEQNMAAASVGEDELMDLDFVLGAATKPAVQKNADGNKLTPPDEDNG